ncbi:MAG TPA: peptidylprolyl isomerase [Candidatus Limnocylindrales bacterium]|nr:peptidylprolyl isomerase [Candidatus Limnocylindrales bacterium]
MTQRVKPATPRPRRSSTDRSSRRTLYLNIGFLVVILVGAATLIGAAIASYAGAHWAEVANVNGVSINRDQAQSVADVELFKLTYQVSQLRDDLAAGRISQADFDSENSAISSQQQNVSSAVVDTMVDDELQRQLAQKQGITVTDAQIDARLTQDATLADARHVLMIQVTPTPTGTGGTVVDADKTKAQQAAQTALTQLQAGTAFATVAKQFSTDTTASTGGDIGWIRQATASQDANFVTAIFALPASGGLTGVITGTDGSYLIGKVIADSPATVDPTFQQRIKDAGISLDDYRAVTRSLLIDEALSAKVTNDAITLPSIQREVSEIKIDTSGYTGPGPQVRARHILYTPGNQDPSASPVASNDPGWAVAQSEAEVTYNKLKAYVGTAEEATQFAQIATTDSKDTGSATDGGLLPYYDAGSGLDPAFAAAIFASGVKAGDLLPPVRSQFGWHVILIDSIRPAPTERAADLQKQASVAGANFATLATANSDATDALQGGDMGWIARDQLSAEQENAIFASPVGSVSQVWTLSDGLYIFKVSQEASRVPDASQAATLKDSAFGNWYALQKSKATITGPDVTPASTGP